MIGFAPLFLEAFGQRYAEAYWALVICAAGYLGFALLALGILLYQFTGHEKMTVIVMVVAAAMGVTGMVVLGSRWSEVGVALAMVSALDLAALLVSLLGWREVRRWKACPP